MKQNKNHFDKKKAAIIGGLSAICITVFAGIYFLTQKPEAAFTPAPTGRADVTDTWQENPDADMFLPSATPESTPPQVTVPDNTPSAISGDETASTTKPSGNTAEDETNHKKPTAPPEIADNVTDPDKTPEYEPSISQPPKQSESTPLQGTASDNTQSVISEDETGSTTNLSDSTTKDETSQEKPTNPPKTTDDVTDPDQPPDYGSSVPQPKPTKKPTPSPKPEQNAPTNESNTNDSHPGQVYDPVFGWIDVGDTQQDTIDSDGDINKQIGTMGGN